MKRQHETLLFLFYFGLPIKKIWVLLYDFIL